MHPIMTEQIARVLVEDRLASAAAARRVRALRPAPTSLRDRAGTSLVRAGERLRQRPARAPQPVGRPC